jgi:hypothetical protein
MALSTIPKDSITADAIDATKIADNAISEEHIDATVITASTALTSAPADTDEFLISDAGTIKRIDASLVGTNNFVILGTLTTNNSAIGNLTFDNIFSSDFDMYRIMGFAAPSNANEALQFQFRTGSSGSNATKDSNYNHIHFGARIDSSDGTGSDIAGDYGAATAKMSTHGVQSDSSSDHTSFDMILSDPNTNLVSRSNWHGTISYQNPSSGRFFAGIFGGSTSDNPDATGITFSYSANNIQYGRITIYGVKHA